ncbi:unnamed protein product [Closterium sp. NIES-53]
MANTPPVPLPPPIDASSVDKLQLAADRSAINWHSFIGSIRRALQPTAPNHPGEPPPLPPRPCPPPPEPNLTVATTPELQAAADATFLQKRREYLIRKAEHDVALLNYEFASSERSTRLKPIAEYNTSMVAYVPNSVAWATADNRACTILLGALPDALMRRFQAREMRANLIWTKLQSMFERHDISSVGVLFQEYFSITLATCDGAIHRLLFNLTPDYESRLHAFTEANPLAGLPEVTQWIIDTEVKLRTPIVNLTTTHSSSASLNATQPRTQGGRTGGSGGRGGSEGGSRGSGRGGRGGSGGGGGPSGPAPEGSSSAGGAVSRGGGRPGTLPPCTYVHRHGPHAGAPCGQTNHPPATCFKALDDAWFDRGNTGTPPCWNSVTPRPSLVDIQTLPSFLPAHLHLLTPSLPSQLQQFQQQQQQYFPQQQQPQFLQQQQPPLFQPQQPPQQQFFQQQQPPQYLPP